MSKTTEAEIIRAFNPKMTEKTGTGKFMEETEMLNQLIESKNGKQENNSRGGYLLTTSVLVFALVFSSLTWSLFAKDLSMGEGNLDVSTLVAPIVENAPAPVMKQEKPAPQQNQTKSAVTIRNSNTLRIEENPLVPKEISTAPNTQRTRPNGEFLISDKVAESDGFRANGTGRENVSGDVGGVQMKQTPVEDIKKPAAPPEFKKPPIETAPKTKPPIQSLGVVNGKAKYLPVPAYTAAAKAIRATGDVNVQILIDESGNVVSANAVSGHPLLRAEAERAARSAKFDPTFLSKQAVKVSGVIVYKFKM